MCKDLIDIHAALHLCHFVVSGDEVIFCDIHECLTLLQLSFSVLLRTEQSALWNCKTKMQKGIYSECSFTSTFFLPL